MKGPKRSSGERSNAWSESKYTNLTPFDPFDSEIPWWRFKSRPAVVVTVDGRDGLPIFVRPLHSAFIRPFGPTEVAAILANIPAAFLLEVQGVYLLGGSLKQIKVASSDLFHFGCYAQGRIVLHPFPRAKLTQRLVRAPKPSVLQRYKRAGVTFTKHGEAYHLDFSEFSLRQFYLYDVLLHELGHHVDRRLRHNDRRASERYAKWFAEAQARKLPTRQGPGAQPPPEPFAVGKQMTATGVLAHVAADGER